MDKDLYANYKAVLTDLKANRESLLEELRQVDAALAALSSKLSQHDVEDRALAKPLPFPPPLGMATGNQVPDHLIYAGISVRWAVLCLMAEHTAEPMRSGEMADALVAGGVRSSGQNFAANVSAVVSEMARQRRELSVDDGKYKITDHGREVWDGIKKSRQYRYRRVEAVPMPETAQSMPN